jgi:hypothetical protein
MNESPYHSARILRVDLFRQMMTGVDQIVAAHDTIDNIGLMLFVRPRSRFDISRLMMIVRLNPINTTMDELGLCRPLTENVLALAIGLLYRRLGKTMIKGMDSMATSGLFARGLMKALEAAPTRDGSRSVSINAGTPHVVIEIVHRPTAGWVSLRLVVFGSVVHAVVREGVDTLTEPVLKELLVDLLTDPYGQSRVKGVTL